MGLFRKHRKWYIDYYYQGRRIREAVGKSKRKANAALESRKGEIVQERFHLADIRPSPYFESVLKEYGEWAKVNHRSWEHTERSRIPPLENYFTGYRLRHITSFLIEQYKKHRRETVKPATVNRELAHLSHILTMAIEWGHLTAHPMKGGRVKKCPGETSRERIITLVEEKKLLAEASPTLMPMIVLALDTGMRAGEIRGLEWERVDLVRGEVLLSRTKNGRQRRVPLTARALKTLQALRKERDGVAPSGSVFLRSDGSQVNSVRQAFKGACRRAGLTGLRFHDLRHTFATRLVTGGADIVTVQRLLGHQTLTMTQRYAHPTSKDIRHAIRILDKKNATRHQTDTAEKKSASSKDVSS